MSRWTPCCAQMRYALEEPDIPITYSPKFREVGIEYLDGGTSILLLSFCPWSGDKLPESLRDAWFDELERRGIDPHEGPIPPEFQTDQWYEQK